MSEADDWREVLGERDEARQRLEAMTRERDHWREARRRSQEAAEEFKRRLEVATRERDEDRRLLEAVGPVCACHLAVPGERCVGCAARVVLAALSSKEQTP